ncbi:hypothetical protein BKA70DRAFT_1241291 [Coprinopsis sp. MPI-PUGE-AT-0042]|nr:hypothetical protein BKA70DRAFT_1241291 [Coprinopsis sp. MPI-PUGE-AT-0042]
MQLKELPHAEQTPVEPRDIFSRTSFALPDTDVAMMDIDASYEMGLETSHAGSTSRVEKCRISPRIKESRSWYSRDVVKALNRTILIQHLQLERLERRFRDLKDQLYRIDGVEGLAMDFALMSLDQKPKGPKAIWLDDSSQWHSSERHHLYETQIASRVPQLHIGIDVWTLDGVGAKSWVSIVEFQSRQGTFAEGRFWVSFESVSDPSKRNKMEKKTEEKILGSTYLYCNGNLAARLASHPTKEPPRGVHEPFLHAKVGGMGKLPDVQSGDPETLNLKVSIEKSVRGEVSSG